MRASSRMHDFHVVVGGLLRVRKKAYIADQIENPEVPGEIVHDPQTVRSLISTKYRQLFNSDSGRLAFDVGHIEAVSQDELETSAAMVSTGKGIGIDCIPDVILSIKKQGVLEKLKGLVDRIFEARSIPTPFKFARLHLLNKLKEGVPGLDDLRPIMISSPLIKLIEAIALQDLKKTLEPLIEPAQVGFLPGLSTQSHLLRLLGKVIDCKNSPLFNSGSWLILFIDFKAAFDRVDHGRLLSKLEEAGVRRRTINIVKLLYNSYHFTLPGDSPHPVGSGVAQGSLISPLLYDLYINDLVSALSRSFGVDCVNAYADDVSVLCLGYSEARRALLITEEWAAKNGAQINKKKCGLLRVTRRETQIGKRDLEGVPFLHEYKYLGVPLDQSFTLKHLVRLVKSKVKPFVARIGILPHSVVGWVTKLNLWSCYARCHFDYFAGAIALCGQLGKFERMYTKSLKRALSLPLQLPNAPLLQCTRDSFAQADGVAPYPEQP